MRPQPPAVRTIRRTLHVAALALLLSTWGCSSPGTGGTRQATFGTEAAQGKRGTEPATCGNHRRDSGETCANCPTDLGPCVPPPSDPSAIDCSSLMLPAPGAPLFVTYRADVASTGLSEVRQVNCRLRP